MRVLGCDLGRPGGLAVVEDGKMPVVLYVAPTSRTLTLSALRLWVVELCEAHAVEMVATERPGSWGIARIGMAQREKQGAVRQACEELKIPLREYQPNAVRKAVTGNGNADKPAVAKMVNRLVAFVYGKRSHPLSEHEWDAVAIALCALGKVRQEQAVKEQRKMVMRKDRARAVETGPVGTGGRVASTTGRSAGKVPSER